MEAVAANKSVDEFGDSINNTEKTLREVGIEIRATATTFRPMGEVIDEVAKKWDTYGDTQQRQIVGAIANIRQANTLLTLFQNYGDVQKYLTAQTESAGLAQDRYAIYLKGVEAAQNRVTASAEEFWQKAISSGAIAGFYNLVAGVIELTTALGGLQSILIVAAVALIYFNSAQIAVIATKLYWTIANMAFGFYGYAQSVGVATAAMELFNTTNPIGWISLLIGAIALLAINIDTTADKLDKLNTKIEESKRKIEDLKSSKTAFSDLLPEYKDLSGKSRDKSEEERFLEIGNELKELIPTLSGYYDDYGNFVVDLSQDFDALTKSINDATIAEHDYQQSLIDSSAALLANNLLVEQALKLKADEKIKQSAVDLTSSLQEASKIQVGFDVAYTESEIEEINNAWNDALDEAKLKFEQMSKEGQQAFVDALIATGKQGEQLANDIFIPLMNKIEELKANPPTIPMEIEATVVSEESQKAFDDLVDATVDMIKQVSEAQKDALQDQLDTLNDVHDSQQDIYDSELDAIKRNADERKESLDREFDQQKRLYDQQRKAIEYQIDSYNRIIDAEKDRLRIAKEAADFQDTLSEKTDALADLESEIAELSLDNSEEALAKRMQLEEQAADLRKEIADDAADYEYQLQIEALDAEATAAEEEANKRLEEMEAEFEQYEYQHQLEIQAIEDAQQNAEEHYRIVTENLDAEYEAQKKSLEDQIDAIDDYLDQEGTLRRDALAMIMDDNSTLYQDLLAWNEKYGTGINKDITDMWELARDAVEEYSAAVYAAPPPPTTDVTSETTTTSVDGTAGIGEHHSGVRSGFVGGSATLRSNEEFAKLLRGELVINSSQMDNFMTNTLPRLMGQSPTSVSNINGGSINVSMPITVGGSLDRSVMPDLEAMVNKAMEKLNSALMSRGYNRNASSFSI